MQFCSNCRFSVEEYRSPLPKNLVETNDPPRLDEKASLSEMLKETEHHLAEIEQTIFRVEILLKGLYRHRDGVKYSLLANKGVLSSIRHIPREVLCEIFSLLLPTRHGSSLNTSEGLWPLSRVCRIWRDAALSFSSAWCNIWVTYGYEHQEQPGYPPQILKNLFANTNGLPIYMNLSIGSNSVICQELLDIAVNHSWQWRDITLTLPTKLISRLRKAKKKLPLLERVVIQHNAKCCLTASHISQTFQVAPALRTVILRDFMGVNTLDLPWSQLTEMQLNGYRARYDFDLFQFYQRLPNLQALHLYNWFPNDFSKESLELPRVRSLHLGAYSDGTLPIFTLQALEELFDVNDRRHVPFLTGLIHRSSCTIKSIRLGWGYHGYYHDNENLLSLFQLTPSATTLILASHQQLPTLLRIMKDSNVLPKLHTLKSPFFDDKFLELVNILQQRQRRLQALTLLNVPGSGSEKQSFTQISEMFGSEMTVSLE